MIKKHGGIFGRNPTFNDVGIDGDLVVEGDLTVNGTETILNIIKLEIEDPNILLGKDNTTDAEADGGGITLQGATDKTITWVDATDSWTFSDKVASSNGFAGNLTGDVTGTVSDISNHTTDALAEGATNLYFSGKTTTDLAEGTNLYYTDARVDTHLTGGTGVTYTTGTIAIGQDVATNADVTFDSTKVADGTLAAPGYSFTTDTGTGLFLTGDDLLGVSVEGTGVISYGSAPGEHELTVMGTLLAYELELYNRVVAAGTTGAQTINRPAGAVNFAAAATSLVVTNNLVTADSIIIATVATNDSTMKSVAVVAGAGSFTLHADAAATAETRVNFIVVN